MARKSTARVNPSEGFVQGGRVIRFEDIDQGRIVLGSTTHRDGQHRAVTGNRCGTCIAKFRADVLGHAVPTPARPAWNR